MESTPSSPRAALRYGFAALCVAAGLLARFLLDPLVGDEVPFVAFYVAVAAAAWYGGLGPAVLTVLLGLLAADYFFLPPHYEFGLTLPHHLADFAGYLTVGLAIALFSEAIQAARRRAERDAVILANVRDAVIVTDLDGVITYWNKGAARLFGWAAEEMLGRHYTDRFPEPARSWMAGQIRERARGTTWDGEHEDYRKDGSRVWVHAFVRRITDPDGRPAGILAVSHDISGRKRAEDTLKEADRRKDDALAVLAHEMRNILAPVCTGLQLLRLDGGDPESRETVDMLERQTGQMIRLVEDILDVSRVKQGKVKLQLGEVELAAVLTQAVETSRPAVAARKHELTVSLPAQPVRLRADRARLVQVFTNLLTNAAKYTDEGGHIRLTAERAGGRAVVRVRDDGVGIAPELLPRVFDLFMQVERSQGGGLGIGLSLVKSLVELHGGTVEARSEGPGQGSEFVVRLPVAEA